MSTDKKVEYDEEIEDIIKDILFLGEDEVYILQELEALYKDTNYPGVLYFLGKAYCFGMYGVKKEEDKGLAYLKQAAEDGYKEASNILGHVYMWKAQDMLKEAKSYFEQFVNVSKDRSATLSLGTNQIASYLISSSGSHYHEYDTYFDGLELLIKASHQGCKEAELLLHILGKDETFVEDYKHKIMEAKNQFISKVYAVSEEDLEIKEEN